MIQIRSLLDVVDNSGVKIVRTIQVLKTKKRAGKLGDFVVFSVKKALPDSSLKKGDLVRGYYVRSVSKVTRKSGLVLSSGLNATVLVNKKREPMGTRVLIPRPNDLRSVGLSKLRSLAPQIF